MNKDTKPLHKRYPHIPVKAENYDIIKGHCNENGKLINRFFDGFNEYHLQIYVDLLKNQKKGKILPLDDDLIHCICILGKYLEFTVLDGLLYQQFEEETDLTQKVGKKNFQVLMQLARYGMETTEGKMLIELNKVGVYE
jgi:hypothetical protein